MPSHTTSQALSPGIKLGSYLIQKILGANMHTFTYQAFDRELKRDVIVKENFPMELAYRDPDTLSALPRHEKLANEYQAHLKQFLDLGQLMSSLNHPGLITPQNICEALGTAYTIFPFIPGNTLDVEVEKRHNAGTPWRPHELIKIFRQILESFQYLHSKNILHRDIRPSHFMLTPAGVPILIGFGQGFTKSKESDVTILVSPDCAAPEQILNNAPYDIKSEIYSLGATFHKLLLNAYPQRADLRFYSNSNPKLTENGDLSEKFTSTFLDSIDRALAPERDNRFASIPEWLHAIAGDVSAAELAGQEEKNNSHVLPRTEPLVHDTTAVKHRSVDEYDEEEAESPRRKRRQKRAVQRKSPLQHIKEFFLKKEDDEKDEY